MDTETEIASAPLPSLGVIVRQLASDARDWLAAEAGIYRLKATITLRSAVWIVGFGAAALILAQAAFVALVIGLLFILAPLIGMAWATVAITGGCLLVIALLAVLIRLRLGALATVLNEREEPSL